VERDKELELLRRKLLQGATAAAAYLAGGDRPPPLSVEGLQVIRADLAARWRHYQLGKTAEIEQAAVFDADRLVTALRDAPESSRLYKELAEATAEVSMLAGAISSDQGDRFSAAHWHAASTQAARRARNVDLVCLTLEDQAWVADFTGKSDKALALLSLMPVGRASPAVVAQVELGRAGMLAAAGSDHAMAAFDRSVAAAARSNGASAMFPRPPMTEDRLARFRGEILVDLGIEGAYRELKPALRAPGLTQRNKGIVHTYLARGAVQSGAIDRACDHAAAAYRLFVSIGSTGQVVRVRRLLERDLAPFTGVRAVKELNEQVRTGARSRYVLCRTSDEGTKVHLRTCQYARRGGARSWAAGEHLEPAEVAASPLRDGYGLCLRCLPT
jgi:hypothetical protein